MINAESSIDDIVSHLLHFLPRGDFSWDLVLNKLIDVYGIPKVKAITALEKAKTWHKEADIRINPTDY